VRPDEDRLKKRLGEIKEQLDQLDAEKSGPPSGRLHTVVTSIVLLLLALGLSGGAVTLGRFSGKDIADATRIGAATVLSCERRGPISPQGFGYVDTCETEIKWADGKVSHIWVGNDFFDADEVGKTITVGDMGTQKNRTMLARADLPPRIWVQIASYALIVLAIIAVVLGAAGLGSLIKRR
jgi:hypothetical protein